MAVADLYRRRLPCPPAVDFSSSEGKELFCEALQNGTMEGFFKLISYFQTQSEPAYCGLATLAVVLNALAIDPGRKWKGPWRWFDESMLDCCEPLEKVKVDGITFGKVACLANCSGAKVEAFRSNQSSIDEFRRFVAKCASSEDCHVITSYHRAPLKQTGSGHFSPIGGYHAGKDMALILDVARFKYPPHWVPLPVLWEAMNTIDETTQKYRGFMLILKHQQGPSLLYTLSCKHESWKIISKYLMEQVPQLLKAEGFDSIEKILSAVFESLPANLTDFIKSIAEVRRLESSEKTVDKEEAERIAIKGELLQQIKETEIYKVVDKWSSSATSCCTLSWSTEDNSSEIIENVCCQREATQCELIDVSKKCFCNKVCMQSASTSDNFPVAIVSGTVLAFGSEKGIDMLVPTTSKNVCCQGAATQCGRVGVANECVCTKACMKSMSTNDNALSGTGLANGSEQGIGMLVPTAAQIKYAPCCKNGENSSVNFLQSYPASLDLLAILLLTLPPQTWNAIQQRELREQVLHLVSLDNLFTGLREEVLHLQRQLHFLYKCQIDKLEEDLGDLC